MTNILLHFREDNECWGPHTIGLRRHLQKGLAGMEATGWAWSPERKACQCQCQGFWVNQDPDQAGT